MPVDASHLKQRITEILEVKSKLKELTSKPYPQLTGEGKYAIRYHIIVLAEALGSMCLHIATEELELKPQSYAECFRVIEEKGVCADCAKDLTKIIRLRNLLTHRYWTIDDRQIYDSIKDDFKGVDSFVEKVREKYAV